MAEGELKLRYANEEGLRDDSASRSPRLVVKRWAVSRDRYIIRPCGNISSCTLVNFKKRKDSKVKNKKIYAEKWSV